jgi:hypothetical protein
MTRVKKEKTPEQIMKINLGKCLTKMKTQVADREALWLDFFGETVNTLIGICDGDKPVVVEHIVKIARGFADGMLDEYESRWGKS